MKKAVNKVQDFIFNNSVGRVLFPYAYQIKGQLNVVPVILVLLLLLIGLLNGPAAN